MCVASVKLRGATAMRGTGYKCHFHTLESIFHLKFEEPGNIRFATTSRHEYRILKEGIH
jgi:hypothetical protein